MGSLCPLDKVENEAQCHSAAESEKRQGILRTRCLRNISHVNVTIILSLLLWKTECMIPVSSTQFHWKRPVHFFTKSHAEQSYYLSTVIRFGWDQCGQP